MDMLYSACTDHTRGCTTDDPTIGTCWDSDRLDLARLSITPEVTFLSTPAARDIEFMLWACSLSEEGD